MIIIMIKYLKMKQYYNDSILNEKLNQLYDKNTII